jgi:alcohol dehydrogenase, propanol-preferring
VSPGRALVLAAAAPIETSPLRLEARPTPVPGPGEILVRVSACGVCRTDLHIVEGELPLVRAPVVPGHQVVGRVVGAGANARRFETGDRVGIAWLRGTCGECEACRRGRENLCESAVFTGYHADGGFADYAVVSEAFAYAIPPVFGDAEAAPLLCAGIIGYRALKLSEVRPGGRLGIYGFGASAHVTLQVARARGCEVFVCTREESHRALARRLGATWVGGIGDTMPAKMHGTILFAPAGELVPVALRALAPGGSVVCAGIHMSDIPSFKYEILWGERQVRSVANLTRDDGERFLELAPQVPVQARTTTYPLERANEALEDMRSGRLSGSAVLTVAA